MSRPSSTAHATVYDEITDKIIADLKAGCVPWARPWASSGQSAPVGLPVNAATGRRYSGINILILWRAMMDAGFVSQTWLTFRQALSLGGHVRKGERGVTVVYADRFVPDAERERANAAREDPRGIPFLKRFIVFNTSQCDDLPALIAPVIRPLLSLDEVAPLAKTLIDATGADFRVGGAHAYYDPIGDHICVPPPDAYFEPINWHRTAFHELGHWTGHSKRLARDFSGCVGSEAYGREELVAEMAGAFVCATLGIQPTVRHADYIGAWLDVLKADNRAIVRAASAASKAADYLLAYLPADTQAPDEPAEPVIAPTAA